MARLTEKKATLNKVHGILPPAGVPVRAVQAKVVMQFPNHGSGFQRCLVCVQKT